MSLPELLQLLKTLEDKVPTILGHANHGIQLKLSPDGSGWIEAELDATGSHREILREKGGENADRYFAYGLFDSLDELQSMLAAPTAIDWQRSE